MTKEALKFALEALEDVCGNRCNAEYNPCFQREAITAIKEALAQPEPWEKFCDSNCVWTDHHPDCKLAQPEQEPVVCDCDSPSWCKQYKKCNRKMLGFMPYVAQPQRTWVGLTDEDEIPWDGIDAKSFAKAIEAKLRSKNGY